MSAVTCEEIRASSDPVDHVRLRKIDGDILIDAINGPAQYTFAAQSLKGAADLVRTLRSTGWACKVRVWNAIPRDGSLGYRETEL